ncbi:MAG: membrane dipeptidase [Bacteroidota bacterium]
MITEDFFVDIHAHPTLRAYNTPFRHGRRNLWEPTENDSFNTTISRWARLKTKEIAKSSQANLLNCAAGKIRVVFDSLYPVEKGFLNFRKLPSAVMGRAKADQVLRTVTGIDAHQLKALRQNNNYFEELCAQYAFLTKGQGGSPDGKYRYCLVANWAELETVTREDPDCIAVVVTVEGAHCFNAGIPQDADAPPTKRKDVVENVNIIKSWDFAPFFINLSHHFYNELAGHSRSFKPPIFQAYNQKPGLDTGITDLGWSVVHEMLARDNGRRILIDIKHMSTRSRQEFYRFVESYNRLNPQDKIPVICSHTGVNEFSTFKDSRRKADRKRKGRGSYFHNWTINLSDEEIRFIHQTGGLIGVMLDKGLLGSPEVLQQIREMESTQQIRQAFVELIVNNIFQVVHAIGDRSAWDVLAVGTDYDGLITHVDIYPDASALPELKTDLLDYLTRTRFRKELWFGYTPEEIVRKIMQTNALAFLRKHF